MQRVEAYTAADFKEWLKKNKQRLRGYAPNEIARVAMACGFDVDRICGPVGDHVAHLRRLMAFWESCSNDYGLGDLWLRVSRIQNGTDD